ncbi:multidrug effflux MFS transporter [Salinarimonas ramus]|uniref:Bcr/CflA family efflux transporter n=1 Tax=Salinarimonas ramus TaxID=690164 RepID=A0A917Q9T1_9HYPH|nr:multidrug effflux MFS transporter [Salinarimonas ramus]GGK37112.1 Bcr/CflA family drug resistance efflux transporter [Salinarimonas ramus]
MNDTAPAGLSAAAPAPAEDDSRRHAPMTFREFVAMIAALMALNALAIDIMLPALQDIGAALGVADENDRQAILPAYLIGFGAGQLLIGSVSDRFGRRPVLLVGLVFYVAAAILCAFAPSFTALLIGRFVQGLASAAPRVVTTSIVRDCYGGRRMASVLSLAMTIFMVVPVIAPSIGQGIVLFAPWQGIFWLLALYGLGMLAWTWARLPETLEPERRRAIGPRALAVAFREVFTTRQTFGYAVAAGAMFGALFSFLVTGEQIFAQLYGLGPLFPVAFAGMAGAMAVSSLINSRLVGRLGTRRLSHTAMTGFVLVAAALLALALLDVLTIVPLVALMSCALFLVGMIFANLNALAMEPMGHIAGTASSVFGSVTTLMAATIGAVLGQAFDGTVVPLFTGWTILGVAALGVIAITERGRLYGRGA